MIEIRKTPAFAEWLDGLRDIQARARIQARIERLAAGKPGNAEPVGEGVSELRINHGPGCLGLGASPFIEETDQARAMVLTNDVDNWLSESMGPC